MLTVFPVWAAATTKSVWRAKNAGICNTSTYSAAIAASCSVCISVTVGTLKVSETLRKIFSAFSSPMPVNESNLLRLAFLKLPLNT